MSKYLVLENGYIQKEDDLGNLWVIPTDPANTDYQAYLAYLATLAANSAPQGQAGRTCYPCNMDFSQTLSEALETELKVPEEVIEYLEANKDLGKKELVK